MAETTGLMAAKAGRRITDVAESVAATSRQYCFASVAALCTGSRDAQ